MRPPLLITFSGLDGAGKSTQIEHLCAQIEAAGLRLKRLAFWDDVVVGKRYREGFVHKIYGSERGIGAPGKPVARRDKNVRHWYLSVARHALYLLDAIHLAEVIARARRGTPEVIIVDRYIYDELANLPLANPLSRGFAQILHAFVPRPDVAYLLDADPEAARARKPEYPLDFMRASRGRYGQLAQLLGSLTVVPPLDLAAAQTRVTGIFWRVFAARTAGVSCTGQETEQGSTTLFETKAS